MPKIIKRLASSAQNISHTSRKKIAFIIVILCAVIAVSLIYGGRYFAVQHTNNPERPPISAVEVTKEKFQYMNGRVQEILPGDDGEVEEYIKVQITSGSDKGKVILLNRNARVGDYSSRRPRMGSEVKLFKLSDGSYQYLDRNRLPGGMILITLMVVTILWIGRNRGLSSLIGLAISIAIIIFFIVPQIIHGHDPFAVCIIGALGIATVTQFVAHGFSRRTAVAFVSTILTLAATVLLSVFASSITYLSGVTSEDDLALLHVNPELNMAGIIFGGVIIATLGLLNDATIGQAAAVDEIHKANPRQSTIELYRKGISVGREHIAALVNTLALAYMGVSLPVIVGIAYYNTAPMGSLLNNEFIMTEIVRSAVSSVGVLLAVPFTTFLAAYLLPRWRTTNVNAQSTSPVE